MANPLADFAFYIQDRFTQFVSLLQTELGIPEKVLMDILSKKEFRDSISINPPKSRAKAVRSVDDEGCTARLKSGARKGECCGKGISEASASGKYCGVHLKMETVSAVREKEAEDIEGEVFRRNAWKNFAYGQTGLILKSETEKKVIGKQLSDGTIIDLSAEDIALCRRRKLKYVANYSKNDDKPEGSKVTGSDTIEHTSKIKF